MKIALALLLAVVFVACQSYRPTITGPEFNEDTPRTITAGVTTRDEIRSRFGTPPTVFNTPESSAQIYKAMGWAQPESWIYKRSNGYNSEATLRIVFTNDIVSSVEFTRITH